MKDGIIKGSGNSRFLKSVENFKTLYPTYDAFVSALVAGTLPVDFNGINAAGWEQIGDALGKNALLKDATAALFGLGAEALPDDVLAAIKSTFNSQAENIASKAKIVTGSFTGTSAGTSSNTTTKTLTFGFTPKIVLMHAANSNASPYPPVIMINGATGAMVAMPGASAMTRIGLAWGSNTLTLTGTITSLNNAGTTYYYAAFC